MKVIVSEHNGFVRYTYVRDKLIWKVVEYYVDGRKMMIRINSI